MSAASDYAENLALKFLLTSDTATRPTTWYVGLFTTATSDAGGGTEVSGGSYARQPITFSVTTDTATNASTITFPTASASWGSIGWVAIYTLSSGGNSLFHGAVTTAKTIDSGDTFQISASNLSITLA
jgi:hypothetical protein